MYQHNIDPVPPLSETAKSQALRRYEQFYDEDIPTIKGPISTIHTKRDYFVFYYNPTAIPGVNAFDEEDPSEWVLFPDCHRLKCWEPDLAIAHLTSVKAVLAKTPYHEHEFDLVTIALTFADLQQRTYLMLDYFLEQLELSNKPFLYTFLTRTTCDDYLVMLKHLSAQWLTFHNELTQFKSKNPIIITAATFIGIIRKITYFRKAVLPCCYAARTCLAYALDEECESFKTSKLLRLQTNWQFMAHLASSSFGNHAKPRITKFMEIILPFSQ